MKIRYVKNQDIDKKIWDELIDTAPMGRIYAYSWFLDALCKHWDALIFGDYKFVMPLPWSTKCGVRYCFTPFFIQQLGIYSQEEVSEEVYNLFLASIPSRIRYIDLQINADMQLKGSGSTQRRTNYTLNINRPYPEIAGAYERGVRQVLRKPIAYKFVETFDIDRLVYAYKEMNGYKFSQVNDSHYERLIHLAQEAKKRGQLLCFDLKNLEDDILASHLFFLSHGRAYFIAGAQTAKGKECNANHFFIDAFIQLHAQKTHYFDFEGSDIPGVAAFFKKWGAMPEYYSQIKIGKFPFNYIKI